MVKVVTVKFDESEFEKLATKKRGSTWHDFFMILADADITDRKINYKG